MAPCELTPSVPGLEGPRAPGLRRWRTAAHGAGLLHRCSGHGAPTPHPSSFTAQFRGTTVIATDVAHRATIGGIGAAEITVPGPGTLNQRRFPTMRLTNRGVAPVRGGSQASRERAEPRTHPVPRVVTGVRA